jgi:hypothetical protein
MVAVSLAFCRRDSYTEMRFIRSSCTDVFECDMGLFVMNVQRLIVLRE